MASAWTVDRSVAGAQLPGRVDGPAFRDVISHLVAGVGAVTAADGSRPVGMTVSSLTSFSDSPPSVAFLVATSARSHPVLTATEALGVHILASDQRHEAEALAGRAQDKFATCAWEWSDEVPRLRAALVFLRCSRAAVFAHGDHTLVVANVLWAQTSPGMPMVYLRSQLGWGLLAVESVSGDTGVPKTSGPVTVGATTGAPATGGRVRGGGPAAGSGR